MVAHPASAAARGDTSDLAAAAAFPLQRLVREDWQYLDSQQRCLPSRRGSRIPFPSSVRTSCITNLYPRGHVGSTLSIIDLFCFYGQARGLFLLLVRAPFGIEPHRVEQQLPL